MRTHKTGKLSIVLRALWAYLSPYLTKVPFRKCSVFQPSHYTTCLVKDALEIHHHDTLVQGFSHFLDAHVPCAFSVVEHHILLVLEDCRDGQSETLSALVGERLAGLDVENVWSAVLNVSLVPGKV